jgi:Right handed beta helix region
MRPAIRTVPKGTCYRITRLTGLSLALAAALSACTTEDPLYCEKDEDCAASHYCDEPIHTCRPKANDASPDGPGDGAAGDKLGLDAKAESGGDATLTDGPDAATADIGPDQAAPDLTPHDTLPPDTKFANGAACTKAAQCASGFCADKVCCDKACGGACDTCAQASKKGTCVLAASGTTCGATTCSGSTLSKKQCNGKSAACQTVSSSCAPYKCTAGKATCATSCTAHTQCTTGLCDLFDTLVLKNKCAPTVKLCYTNAAKPCSGNGTAASPHCTIQACLDKKLNYVSVANGTYYENLQTKSTVVVVAVGTTGALLKGGLPQTGVAKVKLMPTKANTPGVLVAGSYNVALHGFEITPGTGGSGDLFHVTSNGRPIWLRSCYLHHAKSGAGLRLDKPSGVIPIQTVYVEDTAATFNQYGITAKDSKLTIQGASLRSNALAGLRHEGQALSVRDAVIQLNGIGLYAVGSTLDLDRLKVSVNTGEGLLLENNTTGSVFNLLSANNVKAGIDMYNNNKPPVFVNVTAAQNGGAEVSCSTDNTFFYNSVAWDTSSTTSYAGKCFFEHSDVRGGAPGTGNIASDPKFIGSGVDPYALMGGTASPCVDAGDDSISGVTLPALDLAKKTRKVNKLPNTAVIDMGAYEVQ